MDLPEFNWTAILSGVGGFAFGFASYALRELVDVVRANRAKKERLMRLIGMLQEEIEQSCEELLIGLNAEGKDPLGWLITDNTQEQIDYWDDRMTRLSLLKEYRKVFDTYSEFLIELPGYAPNALIRFYGALSAKVARMEKAGREFDRFTWEKLRLELYSRGEVMKTDLAQAKASL